MRRAVIIFIITFLGILFMHNITGLAGINLNFSISKYVGLSSFSSVAFLISNSIVAYIIWRELSKVSLKKFQRRLIAFIVICLIGLSICPIGLYDYIVPEPVILGRTPISFLHVVFSRAMFVAMAGFSAYTFYLNDFKRKYKSITTKVSLAFVAYAVACIACYLFFPNFFWSFDLIIESVYLLGFFAVLLTL